MPCPFIGDDARKLLKALGHHARNKSSTGAIGALTNAAKVAAEGQPSKRIKQIDQHPTGGAAVKADSQAQTQVPGSSNDSHPKFNIGDSVITKATKNKDSFNDQQAVVVQVMKNGCRVEMKTGKSEGDIKLFPFHSLSVPPQSNRADMPANEALVLTLKKDDDREDLKRQAPMSPPSEPPAKRTESDDSLARALYGSLGDT